MKTIKDDEEAGEKEPAPFQFEIADLKVGDVWLTRRLSAHALAPMTIERLYRKCLIMRELSMYDLPATYELNRDIYLVEKIEDAP